MCKVSIIVPIYNVEKFLERCINSILNQSLIDIEIFLASDGPEQCHMLCDKYEKMDSRVRVIKNLGGYGKSVNTCIDLAKGEYIGIVESDDWIDSTMYEKLYFAAKKNNADIAKCGFWYSYDDKSKNNPSFFIEKDRTFKLSEYPEALLFRQTIWSAIYKRTWLISQNIKLCSKRLSYIDAPFQAEAFLKANIFVGLQEPLYFYYQDNPNQSMQNTIKFAYDGIEVKRYMLEKIHVADIMDTRISDAYLFHICRDLFNDYNRYGRRKSKKIFWSNAHNLVISDDFDKIENPYFSKEIKIFMFFLRKFSYYKFYEIYKKSKRFVLKCLN